MTSMNSIARIYALILGAILLVIGVLGWIPALRPGGLFLGLFALSPVHNLVHLLTGLVGLSAGLLLPDRSVRLYTLTMTILYGVVALVGYVQASALEVLALNVPDTLLHTAIFVLSLLVVLAALSEQGFLDRQAELAASLQKWARKPPGFSPDVYPHSGGAWRERPWHRRGCKSTALGGPHGTRLTIRRAARCG